MLGGVTNKSYNRNSIIEEGGNNINNSIDNSQEAFLKLNTKKNTVLE
jgi:hypothetical protein